MLIPSEHILIAPGEVRMHLARQKRIFGNVRLS
jgi:hypothetical protein